MQTTLFFGDVLGFGAMAKRPGASPAVDALGDLARLLSDDELARVLRGSWTRRFALSDSLFLLNENASQACTDAAQLSFTLAFYDATVLLRGALSHGEVIEVPPLFPETARRNLVGEAVVRAVDLEKSGAKGPRLLVAEELGPVLAGTHAEWLLDRASPDEAQDLLWLLPPEPTAANPDMIAHVAQGALDLLLHNREHLDREYYAQYVGYVELAFRSLLRLRQYAPEAAAAVAARLDMLPARQVLQSLGNAQALRTLARLDELSQS